MGKGKLVLKKSVKWEGDLFNLFLFPNQFSQIIPHIVESVDLLAGRWGTVGSVIFWKYNQDGRNCVSKEMIEAIDESEKKKSITYKAIEGDLLKNYKSFKIIVDVMDDQDQVHQDQGEEVMSKMVTWTLVYEKENAGVADPTAFIDLGIKLLNDVERSRQLIPN